ncbi:hypothetical protein EDC52_1024 [Biostraticola tofi]|uniref:Uncharacterized protein n=1 Tax=Biostraticola tofi TaxID=466109 RepID=A0A4R3Z117_9GAMM|nr:hypothetical protein EDC52_1024 [Biostraticola tofi]
MDRNTQGFASYWRNSLADAESGKGAFEHKEADMFTRWMDIATGRLDERIVRGFFEDEGDAEVVWLSKNSTHDFALTSLEHSSKPTSYFRRVKVYGSSGG